MLVKKENMRINPEQDLAPIEVKRVDIAAKRFKIVRLTDGQTLGEAEEGLKSRDALEKLLKKTLNFVVMPSPKQD